MTTQCIPDQLEFQSFGRRRVSGRFDGGRLTSDAGGLLLREVAQRLDLIPAEREHFPGSSGIGVHLETESAFTLDRNPQQFMLKLCYIGVGGTDLLQIMR